MRNPSRGMWLLNATLISGNSCIAVANAQESAPALRAHVEGPDIVSGKHGRLLSPEQEQAFAARVDAHLRVWCEWAASSAELPSSAVEEMQSRILEAVNVMREKYAASLPVTRSNPALSDDFPFLLILESSRPSNMLDLFASGTLSTRQDLFLHPEMIKSRLGREILTSLEREKLTQAAREIVAFRRTAFRDLICEHIAARAMLSPQQRQMLNTELLPSRVPLDSPFLVHSQVSGVAAVELKSLLSDKFRATLLPEQKIPWGLPDNDVPQDYLKIDTGTGRQIWEEALDKCLQTLREECVKRMQPHIDYLQQARDLPPAQIEQLRAAAKGVAAKAVEKRREELSSQMDQYDPRLGGAVGIPGGRFTITMRGRGLTDKELAEDPLWKSTVEGVLAVAPLRAQNPELAVARRWAWSAALLAMLDQELWLSPDQRQKLAPLVDATMPESLAVVPLDEDLSLLYGLAFPLLRIPAQTSDEILHPAQQDVWKSLAGYFELRDTPQGPQVLLRERVRQAPVYVAPVLPVP